MTVDRVEVSKGPRAFLRSCIKGVVGKKLELRFLKPHTLNLLGPALVNATRSLALCLAHSSAHKPTTRLQP